MTRIRHWSMMLLPSKLFSAQVFFQTFGWISLLHFLDVENNAGTSRFFERLLLLFALHVLLFAFPLFFWRLLEDRVSHQTLVISLCLSLVVGGIVRGVALDWGMHELIEGHESAPWVRISASLFILNAMIIGLWVGMSGIEVHKRRREQLMHERDLLLRLRDQERTRVNELDTETEAGIRTALITAFATRPDNSPASMLDTLKILIGEVVRPLTKAIQSKQERWSPPKQVVVTPNGMDWAQVLRETFQPQRIRPALIAALIGWMSITNTIHHRGWVIGVVSLALMGLIGFPAFCVAKKVAERVSDGKSASAQFAAFFLGLAISGQLVGLSTLLYTRFQEPYFYYFKVSPLFSVIGGSLIAFAISAIEQSRALESELRSSADELRWSLARARELHRQRRRALLHSLHGGMQANLAAGILRIEMAQASGEDEDAVALEVANSVGASLAETDLLNQTESPLELVLDRLRATWRGVAEIEVHVEDTVRRALDHDKLCAVAVADVLTEVIFNGVRHGSAQLVKVQIRPIERNLIEVLVRNDGLPISSMARSGTGTTLLDDCSTYWHRKNVDGWTETVAHIPVDGRIQLGERQV